MLILSLVFILGLSFNGVYASDKQNVIVDGKYYDWIVYYVDELGSYKKCYIASFAKDTIGNYNGTRKPYIMIAHFTSKDIEEISIYGGYEYKKNSYIYISIDNKQIKMITKGNMAWVKNEKEDKIIINDIIDANKDIRVRSESIDGKYTIDTYSVLGLARAYKRMKEICRDN